MYISVLKTRYPRLYRKLTFVNVVLVTLATSILWNEYFSYMLMSVHWSNLKSSRGVAEEELLRVLFVADPQLIGLQDEPARIGPISRWDADRYLRSTFSHAYRHVQPEVVVFLGDLLDEGSNASPEDYMSYIDRFHSIFRMDANVKVVYVSGDNDVGGEGFDNKEDWKVAAFNQHFMPGEYPPKDIVNAKFIDFFRLSLLKREVVMTKLQTQLKAVEEQSHAAWRVLCNHEQIVDRYSQDQNQIIAITKANIVFSAHQHHSRLFVCTDCRDPDPSGRQTSPYSGTLIKLEDNRILHLELTDKNFYEIEVPTCSYRMGVPQMAYSAALFDRQGHVAYTAMWLPSRYTQLKYHLISLAVACLLLIGWVCLVTWRLCVYPVWKKYLERPVTWVLSPVYLVCVLPCYRRCIRPLFVMCVYDQWQKLPAASTCYNMLKQSYRLKEKSNS